MMKKFQWQEQIKPIYCLAPMDGWTDSAFRQVIKKISPEVHVFTEFVCVDGITHKKRSKKLLEKAIKHEKIEKPLIVQLFGRDPEKFALASEMMEELGAGAIDINFGCPAKKVISSGHGAHLLKEPDLAEKIVKATKKATKLDVSVKTRLGWDNPEQIFDFGKMLIEAGADALTFHGRTAKQAFAGKADYKNIFLFKEKNPKQIIIGNGDITNKEKAKKILQKLDGIMIGREATRNFWIFREIIDDNFQLPSFDERAKMLIWQAEQTEKSKGKYGVIAMRKFFATFVRGFEGASEIRQNLMQVEKASEAKKILSKIAI